MRFKNVLVLLISAIFCAGLSTPVASQAQIAYDATWALPHGLTVKEIGSRTYKFVVDYNSANSKGEIFLRLRTTSTPSKLSA